jgi:hypothetical protein
LDEVLSPRWRGDGDSPETRSPLAGLPSVVINYVLGVGGRRRGWPYSTEHGVHVAGLFRDLGGDDEAAAEVTLFLVQLLYSRRGRAVAAMTRRDKQQDRARSPLSRLGALLDAALRDLHRELAAACRAATPAGREVLLAHFDGSARFGTADLDGTRTDGQLRPEGVPLVDAAAGYARAHPDLFAGWQPQPDTPIWEPTDWETRELVGDLLDDPCLPCRLQHTCPWLAPGAQRVKITGGLTGRVVEVVVVPDPDDLPGAPTVGPRGAGPWQEGPPSRWLRRILQAQARRDGLPGPSRRWRPPAPSPIRGCPHTDQQRQAARVELLRMAWRHLRVHLDSRLGSRSMGRLRRVLGQRPGPGWHEVQDVWVDPGEFDRWMDQSLAGGFAAAYALAVMVTVLRPVDTWARRAALLGSTATTVAEHFHPGLGRISRDAAPRPRSAHHGPGSREAISNQAARTRIHHHDSDDWVA